MPFYYDLVRAHTSNGTTLTESEIIRLLTVAGNPTKVSGIYGSCRFGTAGGATLRLKRPTAAGSGGTAQVPAKKRPLAPAATNTPFNDATALTAGTGGVVQAGVGCAQTGGMGGWMPFEPEEAPEMVAGGGANGSLELFSIAVGLSVTLDATVQIAE
jgi:hypothetical protein